MRRSLRRFLLPALALALVGAVALAQEASTGADLGARIAELTARARRLSVLSELPAEARPEVEALLQRSEELRRAEQELEVARLEALVAALEAGESPAVARQMAESAVAERRVELTRQREQLDEDVAELAERFPESASLIRRLLTQRAYAAGVVIDGGRAFHGTGLPGLHDLPGEGVRVFRFRAPDPERLWPGAPEGLRRLLPERLHRMN